MIQELQEKQLTQRICICDIMIRIQLVSVSNINHRVVLDAAMKAQVPELANHTDVVLHHANATSGTLLTTVRKLLELLLEGIVYSA